MSLWNDGCLEVSHAAKPMVFVERFPKRRKIAKNRDLESKIDTLQAGHGRIGNTYIFKKSTTGIGQYAKISRSHFGRR